MNLYYFSVFSVYLDNLMHVANKSACSSYLRTRVSSLQPAKINVWFNFEETDK